MNASNFSQHSSDCLDDSDIVRTVKVMAIMLVAGIGVFGNVLVIFIAAKYARKTNIRHLIVNMAVSDTLVALIFLHEKVSLFLRTFSWGNIPYSFAIVLCKMEKCMDATSRTVSLMTLLMISIERYRATRLTALRVRVYTLRQRVAAISFSWLVSLALCSFTIFSAQVVAYEGMHICKHGINPTFRPNSVILSSFVCILLCVVPLLSILTLLRLRRPSAVQANLTDVQRQVRAKGIANTVRMAVCSVILYGLLYSPSLFLFIYYAAYDGDYDSKIFTLRACSMALLTFMCDFLVLVNSCLSPYVYLTFLSDFRRAAKRLLLAKPATQGNNASSSPYSPEAANREGRTNNIEIVELKL